MDAMLNTVILQARLATVVVYSNDTACTAQTVMILHALNSVVMLHALLKTVMILHARLTTVVILHALFNRMHALLNTVQL